MSSESLSVEIKIKGTAISPRDALSHLLSAVAQSLGPDFLGHIKGIARFPEGVLYGSTVGLPPEVNFQLFGQMPVSQSEIDFEMTCIGINMERQQLLAAVEKAVASSTGDYLIQGNYHDRTHQH